MMTDLTISSSKSYESVQHHSGPKFQLSQLFIAAWSLQISMGAGKSFPLNLCLPLASSMYTQRLTYVKYLYILCGTVVYVCSWKGGMSAHMEGTFVCPQKRREGVSDQGRRVSTPGQGRPLTGATGGQAGGGTHISINLPKAI